MAKKNRIELIAQQITANGKVLTVPANSILLPERENMGSLAQGISETVGNEINYINSVVKPAVGEYMKKVASKVEAFTSKSSLSKYRVAVMDIPEFINIGMERGIYEITSNQIMPTNAIHLPMPTPAFIRGSYIRSDIGAMDVAIKAYGGFITDDVLKSVWEKYIMNISNMNGAYGNLGYEEANGVPGLELFVLSIILPNLKENPPEGVRASLVNYNNALNGLISLVNTKIKTFIRNYERMVDIGTLIVRSRDDVTTVVKEHYNKFLNDGGIPDVIMGYVMKTGLSGSSAYDKVIAMAKESLETWELAVKRSVIADKLDRAGQYQTAYALSLSEMMHDYFDKQTLSDIESRVLGYEETIKSILETVGDSGMLYDIPKFSEYVIAKWLFCHTNAHVFFSYMRDAVSIGENITPNEAASYATFRLITDYVASQATLEDI